MAKILEDTMIAKRYGQEVRLLKMGRMLALMVIGKDGQVAYKHYGGSMSDIPPNPQILSIQDRLNREADQIGRSPD